MKNKIIDEYNLQRELNIRKIVTIIILAICVIAIIVLFSFYIAEADFRKWVDINVFRKEITNSDVPTIDLSIEKNNQVYCYSKYICVLNDKNLKIYNQNAAEVSQMSININTASFVSNDKYLAIAEKSGQEFCVIFDKTYMWDKKVDGEIKQIAINKNGYVAVVTTDTTYKSIITVFDSNGKQLLKNYLALSRVVDVSISKDNKYVAYAEIDTSGTLIQSTIKTLSIEKAMDNPEQAIVNSYQADVSKMIVNIEYQDKSNLICIYDNMVQILNLENNEELISIDPSMTFVSGTLSDSVVYIIEEKKGIFNSDSIINIVNTASKQKTEYKLDEIAKQMYTYDNIIAANIGTEIYFINTNGLLIKKYTSNQEISNIILSNNLATIIYKDRVEIINL